MRQGCRRPSTLHECMQSKKSKNSSMHDKGDTPVNVHMTSQHLMYHTLDLQCLDGKEGQVVRASAVSCPQVPCRRRRPSIGLFANCKCNPEDPCTAFLPAPARHPLRPCTPFDNQAKHESWVVTLAVPSPRGAKPVPGSKGCAAACSATTLMAAKAASAPCDMTEGPYQQVLHVSADSRQGNRVPVNRGAAALLNRRPASAPLPSRRGHPTTGEHCCAGTSQHPR